MYLPNLTTLWQHCDIIPLRNTWPLSYAVGCQSVLTEHEVPMRPCGFAHVYCECHGVLRTPCKVPPLQARLLVATRMWYHLEWNNTPKKKIFDLLYKQFDSFSRLWIHHNPSSPSWDCKRTRVFILFKETYHLTVLAAKLLLTCVSLWHEHNSSWICDIEW